jgi:hypothetical protein
MTNEIQTKKNSNDIKTKFGLEKCAKICFQIGKVHRKQYMGNTMETDIKELDLMKT